ncbi:sugar O-acetyltransferase [Companilactobacillus baiquanensis]|uniref:Sugar O-acetyltransferase n=1 Tax=Companilactobacillus baiquanensis TaxID=2486005 RepID=A0ABW1UUH8_9LACO|nr:sugar O-acetyltransferase [Companilactobacillus baiquanensis]
MISQEKIKQFKKLINSGEIYDSVDEEFIEYQHSLVQRINELNQTSDNPDGLKKRQQILKEVVGTYGDNLYVIPPIHSNTGLVNVHFGKDVLINFNCNFVDDGAIYFGDNCMVGPNVTFATAIHPVSPKLRESKLQYNKPITIEKNVWIGASATILPGVTVGEGSIIGAGSVVTKDVESNVVVVGNPARKIRSIDENDDKYYDSGKKIPEDIIEKYL